VARHGVSRQARSHLWSHPGDGRGGGAPAALEQPSVECAIASEPHAGPVD
jgi:hypothetical protein